MVNHRISHSGMGRYAKYHMRVDRTKDVVYQPDREKR